MTFSYHYDDNIQYVPDAFEIGELVYSQLENLFHNVVEDEQTEDHLAAEDEEIPGGDVANQFDRSDLVGRDRSASRREFNHQPERAINFGQPVHGYQPTGEVVRVALYLMTQNMLMFAL